MLERYFNDNSKRGYHMYHRLRNKPLIWKHIINKKSRELWRQNKMPLNYLGQRILADLERDGIASARIEDFNLGDDILERMNKFVESRLKEIPKTDQKKNFWVNIWPTVNEKSVYEKNNPFLELLASNQTQAIISNYLGLSPRLLSFSMLKTLVIPENTKREWSQNWHRDPEDRRIVKVFVYMSDVDKGSGPFTYVENSKASGSKYAHLWKQIPPAGSYPSDSEVKANVDPKDIVEMYGKKGSVIFCDTSGLHRGGFSTTNPRIMFMSGFASDASVYPRNFNVPEDIEGIGRLGQIMLR